MKKILLAVFLALTTPCWAADLQEGKDYELAFSPHQGATELVVKHIEGAKESIRVAAYSFTSKAIAEALVNAHRRGIDIKVVLDKSQNEKRYSAAIFLQNMEVPVRINSNYAIMHNKYIIVDSKDVELGSFNYTKAAEERNAENVLVLKDIPEIAGRYLEDWQKLWDESTQASESSLVNH